MNANARTEKIIGRSGEWAKHLRWRKSQANKASRRVAREQCRKSARNGGER